VKNRTGFVVVDPWPNADPFAILPRSKNNLPSQKSRAKSRFSVPKQGGLRAEAGVNRRNQPPEGG
jgi:hypothetical protein